MFISCYQVICGYMLLLGVVNHRLLHSVGRSVSKQVQFYGISVEFPHSATIASLFVGYTNSCSDIILC